VGGALAAPGAPNEAIAWTICAVEPTAAPELPVNPVGDAAAIASTTHGAPAVPIALPTKAFKLALY
jgi:hypothetical protein